MGDGFRRYFGLGRVWIAAAGDNGRGCACADSRFNIIARGAGEADSTANPLDTEAIADGTRPFVENAELRAKLSGAGNDRAKRFTRDGDRRFVLMGAGL